MKFIRKNLFYIVFIFSEVLYLCFYSVEFLKEKVGDNNIVLRDNRIFIFVLILLWLLFFIYLFSSKYFFKEGDFNLSFKKIFWTSVVFNITLLFVWPIASIDIFSYIYRARIFSEHHLNPYEIAYSQLTHDAFYDQINNKWSGYTTLYGPLFVLLSSFIAFVGKSSLWMSLYLMKLLMIVLNISIIYFLQKTLKNEKITFLYAWNPFILFEFCLNGHNDVLLALFLVLSFYFLFNNNFKAGLKDKVLSFSCLVLAVLSKITIAILLPIFFFYLIGTIKDKHEKFKFFFYSFLITTFLTCLFYFPFWTGLETLYRPIIHSGHIYDTMIFASFGMLLVSGLFLHLGFDNFLFLGVKLSKAIFFLSYITIFYYIFLKRKNLSTLFLLNILIFSIASFYLFFFTWLMPWYFVLMIILLLFAYVFNKQSIYIKICHGLTFLGICYYLILR